MVNNEDEPEYLYRGRPYDLLNKEEFKRNQLPSTSVEIHYLEGTEDITWQNIMVMDSYSEGSGITMDDIVREFDLEHVRKESKTVTGGLTPNVGSAIHFSHDSGFGGVLVVDRDKLHGDVKEIRYHYDYFNENPEVFARVDNFAEDIVVLNGDLFGALNEHFGGDRKVQYWGKNEVKGVVERWSEEREWVDVGETVNLDAAVEGVVSFFSTGRGIPVVGQVDEFLDTLDGFSKKPMYSGEPDPRDINDMTLEEKTVELYEKTARTARIDEEYIRVVIYDTDNFLTKPDKGTHSLHPDAFELMYDGEDFIRNYDWAEPFVGVRG